MKPYSLSFVLPMYNEAANMRETLQRVGHLAAELTSDYEIVVADDASTDDSAAIVEREAARDARIRLVRLARNTKFGGALSAGLHAATKEVIIYTDSDLPIKEEDMAKALALLDGADIVTAYSLALKDASFKRIIMSKVYNFLVNLFFSLKIRDINSGFKIYKRSIIHGMRLGSRSPFIDVEIFAEAAKRGAIIKQHGIVFDLRTKGVSTISRPSVVVRTFWDMIAYRFFR